VRGLLPLVGVVIVLKIAGSVVVGDSEKHREQEISRISSGSESGEEELASLEKGCAC
jgi:hypothetical protein